MQQIKPHEKFYADMAYLEKWANHFMTTREPNFIIRRTEADYMRRWWVVPRNYMLNIYLHEILLSDDDRALHDHPWDNTSLIIAGHYDEMTPDGIYRRVPGDVIHRKATDAHRLIVPEGERVISLFQTGPMIREWGFHCPQGWRRWQDFVELSADGNQSMIGRGCD